MATGSWQTVRAKGPAVGEASVDFGVVVMDAARNLWLGHGLSRLASEGNNQSKERAGKARRVSPKSCVGGASAGTVLGKNRHRKEDESARKTDASVTAVMAGPWCHVPCGTGGAVGNGVVMRACVGRGSASRV